MEEEIQDVATDTDVEVDEATNSNEEVQEDTEALKAKLEVAEEAKRQITARAKKAEEKIKILEARPQENIKPNDPQLTEELKLIARGLSDEEIEQAKVIAKGKGIVLTEAVKDPLFVIYQGDLKDKQRKEKAKLGASKGSGETKEEITGLEAGSSRDEHKKAFDKLVGKK